MDALILAALACLNGAPVSATGSGCERWFLMSRDLPCDELRRQAVEMAAADNRRLVLPTCVPAKTEQKEARK